MKLSRSSLNYTEKPAILEGMAQEIGARYGGRRWSYRYPRHIPHFQPPLPLQEREIALQPFDRAVQLKHCPCGQDCPGYCCRLPGQAMALPARQAAQAHLENIRANLERRLRVAKARAIAVWWRC
ncbi:MAG: hypothetical protein HC890_09000 [Chloroflexaceae bacterium]|nr:hypothetical protein [Chloroflexaceae bacterium]